MKRKKKKASRIFSFILAMMFLTTAFFSNLVDAKERNLSDNSSVDKQERIQLAQKLGLEKWIDSDGYLSEDYYKDKTDLELSEMGVAPLIHTIDLNSEVMTLSVTKYQKVSYGNTIVGYFEVDGYPSLCCEHDRGTPEAGSSTGSWEEITDANLRTVMYYGYTGPGNIFSDYNKGCVGTSLALSYYVRGLSSTGMGGPHSAGAERVGMSQLIYKAEQKASVPSGFKVYRVTTNGGSTQSEEEEAVPNFGTNEEEEEDAPDSDTKEKPYVPTFGRKQESNESERKSEVFEELTASVLNRYLIKNEPKYISAEIKHSEEGEQLHVNINNLDYVFLFSSPAAFDISAPKKKSRALDKLLVRLNTQHPGVKFYYDEQEHRVYASGYFSNTMAPDSLMEKVHEVSDCFRQK